jgi:hypothetical protein
MAITCHLRDYADAYIDLVYYRPALQLQPLLQRALQKTGLALHERRSPVATPTAAGMQHLQESRAHPEGEGSRPSVYRSG